MGISAPRQPLVCLGEHFAGNVDAGDLGMWPIMLEHQAGADANLKHSAALGVDSRRHGAVGHG